MVMGAKVATTMWDKWAQEAYAKLESANLVNHLRPFHLENDTSHIDGDELEVYDDVRPWDRSTVEVKISESTFRHWLMDISASDGTEDNGARAQESKNLILFSGNDYMALSCHPSVTKVAAKAMLEHGMGPRGSAPVSAYTNYHKLLESSLANLKKSEECLVCPTGFGANMAVMVTVASVASLLASNGKPEEHERVAIFSDALNHASIVDGISIAQRQRAVQLFVYRHSDMSHLESLLSSCTLSMKVVVTDSLFSMDGDFAPMNELAKLRQKYGFLLVVDDAHGTLVCGKNGGGASEQFNCEKDVDITTATLSKAVGCQGGFITCSKTWKQLIQAKGRNFIFSTTIPVPIAAAARASVIVGAKEKWRRRAVCDRIQDFRDLTGIPISSHIISLVIGTPENALEASKHLLKCGFHVVAIKPPLVAPNSCRLRVSLSAAHTRNDMERLVVALAGCINFETVNFSG